MTLLIPRSYSQNLESIGKEEPIKVGGGISLNQIFYGSTRTASRRDPYSYFLTGSFNASIYGLGIPFGFAVSNQNRSFQQPFNQFRINPTYKWAKSYVGYTAMTFSPYTLNGHIFRGLGVDLTPGKFHLSAMYGQLRRATPGDSARNVTPTLARKGFGLRTGYRSGVDVAEISLFHSEDEINSLASADSSTRPEENMVLGLTFGKKFFDKVSVQAELATSAITRNTLDPEGGGPGSLYSFGGLFTTRESTGYYNAMKTAVNYQLDVYSLGAAYERIDPGYRTHGAYYFNNDLQNYTIMGSGNWLDTRLSASFDAGIQRDNLDEFKISTLERWVGALNLAYTPNEHLSLSGSYSNFQSFTHIRSQFIDINQVTPYDNLDTLRFTQIAQSINLGANYNLKGIQDQRQFLSLNFSIQDASERQSDVIQNTGSRFFNLNSSYTLSFIPQNLNFTFSYNLNQNKAPQVTLITHGPSASVSKALMKRNLRLTLSSSYNSSNSDGAAPAAILNIRTGASYTIAKKHNLSLGAVAVQRNAGSEGGSFSEFTGTLTYGYSF